MAGPALTDVPDRYDVVFRLNDGTTYGFLFADSVESNLPFRTHKAVYSYSPTFLERQNVSDQYGDNFQDFFLTGSQDDFSLGESQKFFRVNDQDRSRRYWAGRNVDPTTVPGNVTLTKTSDSVGSALINSATSACASPWALDTVDWYLADNTNLYSLTSTGTVVNIGTHGAGNVGFAAPMVVDQSKVYIPGSSHIRTYNGASFATFSSTVADRILYLNNTLYGYVISSDSLVSYDTSGNATTQFQWKNPDGTAGNQGVYVYLSSYGGVIYILRAGAESWELWTYDGAGARILARMPPDFYASGLCVASGVAFISGTTALDPTSPKVYAQVYYYVNGSLGLLWQNSTTSNNITLSNSGMSAYGDGLLFNDTNGNILQYTLSLGGVHTIANVGAANTAPWPIIPSLWNSAVLIGSSVGAGAHVYKGASTYNSTGYVQTSQYDFDNTLSKIFRGIKIDADIPANTSVDIAYQIDGCGGTYTTLKTGATSGTEYLLPNGTSGHSISVQVTLNSATGSATPTLKRVYVRAAPTLQQFRKREYLFDLSGGTRDELGKTARRCRDGTAYPVDPDTAASNLEKIATQTIPFTVADRRTGSAGMTVLPDLQQSSEGYEGFALYDVRPNVYIGRINLREV